MSRIVFLKMDGEDQVEIRMSGDVLWTDIAERFVGFLQACGYVVNGADIAQYMSEIYGTPIDNIDVTFGDDISAGMNTITVTAANSDYDFAPLNNVMNNWGSTSK